MNAISRRCFLASAATLLHAQPQDATFSSDVKIVNLFATVRTKKGAIVRDLTKDDFLLLESGSPQTIRYFSKESDLPLTIGLMVDTSMSQERVLDAERGASFRFLAQVMRDKKDQIFVMQFDMTVQTRQALTSSRKQLDSALVFVDTPTRRELRSQNGGGTLLYDSIVQASEDIMAKQTGRKALIVLSDGGENGSDADLATSIEAAHRAGTLVYTIYFADGAFPSFGFNGKGVMNRLAKETGGASFEVSKKTTIDQIYSLIEEDLRNQYSLGYVPEPAPTITGFRRLQLSVKPPKGAGLVVQSRDKYWAEVESR